MANYKVAYGKRENINSAITGGVIPPGCIILTEDSSEIFFYDLTRNLKIYESRNKFSSKEEAEEWIREYDCSGQIITIHEGNKCNAYIVDYTGKLASISSTSSSSTVVSVQADFLIEDPSDPAYIKNKPKSLPITFIDGLEEILASKIKITNQAIPGALMISDGSGNIKGSDTTLESLVNSLGKKVEITDPIIEGSLMVSDGKGGLVHADATPQQIFSTLSRKVEVSGNLTPGALMIASEDGNLQCCGIKSSDVLLKSDVIVGSIMSTVTLNESGVYVIKIPEEILKYPTIYVYHNGMLLVQNVHYTVASDFITLIGHSTYSGDLFTFVGYGSTGSLVDIGSYHTHPNKYVLDSITQEMVDAWNSSAPTNESYVSKEEIFGSDGLILPELLPKGIGSGLELGVTSETAFRGDYGFIAYEHSQEDHAPATAQENIIEEIAIGGALLPIVNKRVTISVGDEETLGVVKSSREPNKVFIEEDGTMSITSVDASKLSVPEGDELILVSGDSTK